MSNVMTKLDDIGDCSDTFDKVWSIDDGEEVGTITRHWPGFCKQVFNFSNNNNTSSPSAW